MTTAIQLENPLDETRKRIVEVRDAMRNSSYAGAGMRRVRCRFSGNRLILSGPVPSYYVKQVAQCLALKHWGALVDNKLEVESETSSDRESVVENGFHAGN